MIKEKCARAKEAFKTLSVSSGQIRNNALVKMAEALKNEYAYILSENQKDVATAHKKGISEVMVDRLRLTQERIFAISASILKVCALPDPLGKGSIWTRPNGLTIQKVQVPIGVIGIIYESRPNVTADAAALCVKSGNAVILRGGSEAIHSNIAIVNVLRKAIEAAALPADCIQIIEDTARDTAVALMKARGDIDLLIPRGGKALIKTVTENSSVPVIETGAGNCHIYVDESADFEMALNIIDNAKTSRPSVCNAVESLLVHRSIAKDLLPLLKKRIPNVELRGCPETLKILPDITPATEEDFYTEYNDYILSVKIVSDVKEAVEHINEHSTRHSDAVITNSTAAADYFTANVDSAAVYVNASTRFTDGEEFGFGAEIGISTQKMHARGPMGLDELTTIKYKIIGSGQIR
ncbi:MAG TPA: glutamate-5-semialdehyde dehydrogenase [Bacillota bacterium]|nr:glutamate-5-semialdehyde dehydrogenase [Bacillota bacterium]HOK68465.1 glutamate-5-semialdehyde dehydrogenase [Bacillota bacterium]HPP86133.1 glutamate-5-semialdehyde dehydrogenase [Bacillota bacterium]